MLQLEHDVTYNTNGSMWKGFKEGRLRVDDKGLVFLSYKINPVWHAISIQFGLIGGLIYEWFASRKRKQMQEMFQQEDLRALAANDKDSAVVEFNQIESFEVKSGLLQGNSIKLFAGDRNFTIQGKKQAQEEIAAVLRTKCGGREKMK